MLALVNVPLTAVSRWVAVTRDVCPRISGTTVDSSLTLETDASVIYDAEESVGIAVIQWRDEDRSASTLPRNAFVWSRVVKCEGVGSGEVAVVHGQVAARYGEAARQARPAGALQADASVIQKSEVTVAISIIQWRYEDLGLSTGPRNAFIRTGVCKRRACLRPQYYCC